MLGEGLILLAVLLLFAASQFFWIGRLLDVAERFLPGRRPVLTVIAALLYLFVIVYSFPSLSSTFHVFRPADYRLSSLIIEAAFWWWFVGSLLGFALVMVLGMVGRFARAAAWICRKLRAAARQRAAVEHEDVLLSPARRRFLEQTAVLVSATPFVAAGYGLLYERLDVEVVRRRIRLARLPKAFEGFRIAQLSDFHLGPFAPVDYVRRSVALTNELKPDLIALTGDYIAWDPAAMAQVVHALADLRAPHGVLGCLGNHEEESETEDSTTQLFAAAGIRILRQERATVASGKEMLNFAGIDCPRGPTLALYRHDRNTRLRGLVVPGRVNVLLSHYPDVFGPAAELGFDLTLAGHTHGGQLSVDFIHQGLNLSQVIYNYNSGWHEKEGAQLYVNRGIGTTGFPIRLGAPPEITILELAGD